MRAPKPDPRASLPPPLLSALLRAGADALDKDLAVWAARDPMNPSPEVRQARRSAIATLEALLISVRGLLAKLDEPRRLTQDPGSWPA